MAGGEIDFCTLGMFIIDDIEFEPPRPPVKDIIGGAGAYAAIGARIVAGQEHSKAVGWIVDCGSDFPPAVRETISSWDTFCVFREDANRLTTRGWNGYGSNEMRAFKYLTPKLRLDHNSLTEPLLLSRSFHLICSPVRCCELVKGILQRRSELLSRESKDTPCADTKPIFVWEPVPDLCLPEELPNFYKAINYVDVVSPNENELARFFGKSTWERRNSEDLKIAQTVVEAGIGPKGEGALVVRAGKDGCYVFSQSNSLELPAYSGISAEDPTGAGNAFLGALAEGLVSPGRDSFNLIKHALQGSETWQDICRSWGEGGKLPVALICAIVAASFVIEQVGMPQISFSEEGQELWNGSSYTERIRLYTAHLIYDTFSKNKNPAD